MERKMTFVYIISTIIVAGLLTYHFGKGTLLGISKFQTSEYTSLQNLEIVDAKLLNENTIYTTTDDSQIILQDMNGYVQNITITIDETSKKDFAIQVFFDTGRGFNAEEVTAIWGKYGKNFLVINCQKQIRSIRIDATNLNNHQLTIGKITLNQQASSKALSLILIFNAAFLLFITLFYTRTGCRAYKGISFIFYTAVLYIADKFWLINAPPVFNILFFVVLCLVLVVVQLIWKEINKNGNEEHQK